MPLTDAQLVHTRSSGRRPRILVFAYACEPDKGSEPAAGWGLVQAASEVGHCTVLVGPEHSGGLGGHQGHPNVTFIEVAEPRWYRAARRHRLSRFLLYLAWLRRAHQEGKRLHLQEPFDLVHHATYSTYWLPSPATSFGVPSVWGPVGGAVTTPLRLWPSLGPRGLVEEIVDIVAVRLFSMLPATRRTCAGATVCLVQNEATLRRLPESVRAGARVFNHALLAEVPGVKGCRRRGEILFVGALESRKGARLALRALAHAEETVRLIIVGDGPERSHLEALARRYRLLKRVEFKGRVPHAEVFEHLSTCAAAVFVGLREEGGIALAEAMLLGVPVIVLGNGGARTVAEATTDPSRVALVPPGSATETARRLGEAMTLFSKTCPDGVPLLDHHAARRSFAGALQLALASRHHTL
jgi:glycosyltransferase involved in cell wall biosynthesis